MSEQRHAVIVGAGLAGSLLACMLGDDGWRVDLYETRPDPRAQGFIGGRSINLALSVRGITALDGVGLSERVLEGSVPMPGRMMHSVEGELTFQPYSARPGDAIHSVSRGGLNLTLLEAADKHEAVTLSFSQRCVGADLDATSATFIDEITGESMSAGADLLIGADGAWSSVRAAMQITERFSYSQSYLEHSYKELIIPPASECGVDPNTHDGFAMEPNALHIWPRGGAMMIALPNADRTFTCTLFWAHDDFAQLDTDKRVLEHFRAVYPDAVGLMPTLTRDYRENPVGLLATIRCSPWNHGRVCVIGDAAHGVVPFFGQGMNASFEDCRLLREALRGDAPIEEILAAFARERKPDADAIADMAIENFLTMRDRVADPAFLFRKRVEQAMDRIDPERYTPLYNLVSFSNVPYAQARREGGHVVAMAERIAGDLRERGGEGLDDEALTNAVRAMIERERAG